MPDCPVFMSNANSALAVKIWASYPLPITHFPYLEHVVTIAFLTPLQYSAWHLAAFYKHCLYKNMYVYYIILFAKKAVSH